MNNWTYISMMKTTLNDQNHISENCIGIVIYFFILTSPIYLLSPIRLPGEGRVYDLYCSQPPGGDQRARSFTLKDEWDTRYIYTHTHTHTNVTNGIKVRSMIHL